MNSYEIITIGLNFLILLATSLAVYVAKKTLNETNKRERKQETIKYIEDHLSEIYGEIKKEVFIILDKNYHAWKKIMENPDDRSKIIRFLNNLEHLSVGVNHNIYDLEMLNDCAGSAFYESYKKLKSIIESIREDNQKTTTYENIISVAERISKLRNKQ